MSLKQLRTEMLAASEKATQDWKAFVTEAAMKAGGLDFLPVANDNPSGVVQ